MFEDKLGNAISKPYHEKAQNFLLNYRNRKLKSYQQKKKININDSIIEKMAVYEHKMIIKCLCPLHIICICQESILMNHLNAIKSMICYKKGDYDKALATITKVWSCKKERGSVRD